MVYLEKMDIYPNTRLYTQVGYRSPAYCSSMGKYLLACLSGDELDEVLYLCKFEKHTPNTITDAREFKHYLKIVRRQTFPANGLNETGLPYSGTNWKWMPF